MKLYLKILLFIFIIITTAEEAISSTAANCINSISHTTPETASQPEWNLMWQQYMGAVDKRTDLQVWTLSMVHSESSREAYLNYWRTGEGRMKAMFTEIGAQWTDPEVLVMSAAAAVAGLSGMRAPGVKGGTNLLNAANAPGKGGLTEVGRALQKHGSRPGSVFPKATGNPAAINAQGEAVLKSILENPNVQVIRNSGSFIASRYGGGVVDYIIPNGMGARFSADGTRFIGFLNP